MNSDRKASSARTEKNNSLGDYGEVQKRYLQELSLYHQQIKKIRKLSGGNKAA